MVKRKTAMKIRKAHRYLGIFIGIQFLMWTISGMYFSWTDIDEIHGDHFKKLPPETSNFENLAGISTLIPEMKIHSISLKEVSGMPYYFVNNEKLVHAQDGKVIDEISEEDARNIAQRYVKDDFEIISVEKINEVGDHHEYRSGSFPAYVINYAQPKNLKAYVGATDASFKTVRYRDWRWFDFLWMTHTMDYEGRDDFNNLILRIFSLMGLITVLSGFLLWYISSPSIRKFQKKFK